MATKKKLNFGFIANLGYFDFYNKTINGVKGTVFVMCCKLSEKQREEILSYKNTKIGTRQFRYAPEIKHDLIFLGNKCF